MTNNIEYKSLTIENNILDEEKKLQENYELNTIDAEDSKNLIINENDEKNINDKTSNFEETNCLALTVRKDYGLFLFKNGVVKTFKVSCKIIFCTVFLNLLTLLL